MRHRCNSESGNTSSNYADQEVAELLAMLREEESLEEQGDILQYLVDTHGLDFNTGKLIRMCYIFFAICKLFIKTLL